MKSAIIAAAIVAGTLSSCSTVAAEDPDDILVVLENCELIGVMYRRERREIALRLPAGIYPNRHQSPTAGRVACFEHWARERGFQVTIELMAT